MMVLHKSEQANEKIKKGALWSLHSVFNCQNVLCVSNLHKFLFITDDQTFLINGLVYEMLKTSEKIKN